MRVQVISSCLPTSESTDPTVSQRRVTGHRVPASSVPETPWRLAPPDPLHPADLRVRGIKLAEALGNEHGSGKQCHRILRF